MCYDPLRTRVLQRVEHSNLSMKCSSVQELIDTILRVSRADLMETRVRLRARGDHTGTPGLK